MAARTRKVTVVGAGLGGSLFAVFLGRAGHDVTVYERRPDPRKAPSGRSRSINLAISTRGLHALSLAGLDRAVLDVAVPMRGRMIHAQSGALTFQPYGSEAQHVINSVSRAGLNRLLVEAAEALPNVEVVFGKRCAAVDLERGAITLEDARTGALEEAVADFVVSADGAYSEVRGAMQRSDRFDYSQSYLPYGYKELSVPPGAGGSHRMEPEALHIWPRGGFMMIALPNTDGSFTCTCFWPFDGENGLYALRTREEVRRYFTRVFPDAVPLIPDLEDDYLANPVGSLVTVRCSPWHWKDKAVLLGDAAHAIVPFYGQGANASFEDCAVLDACLKESPDDLEAAFREYGLRRKEHTDTLADLAIGNFVEMRDKTASKTFLLFKKLEKGLARLFPGRFLPLYSMVTFSRIPYADAVRRARKQWSVVAWSAAGLAFALAVLLGMLAAR
jgi:kynurenine 3-monooxygenase